MDAKLQRGGQLRNGKRKLKKMSNIYHKIANNQISIKGKNKIVFLSYETEVCVITNFENGNHPVIKVASGQPQSDTTRKYLNQFILLHTGAKGNFKTVKKVINK